LNPRLLKRLDKGFYLLFLKERFKRREGDPGNAFNWITQERQEQTYFLTMNVQQLDGTTINVGNMSEAISLSEFGSIIKAIVRAIEPHHNSIYAQDLIEVIEIKANANTARKSKLILESWRKMFHSEDQLLLTFDLPMNVIGTYQPRPQQQYQAGAAARPACTYI
jgi:hypothetical protein